MIRLTCRGCAKTLVVDDARAGKLGKCLRCGTLFRVPGGKPPAAPPPDAITRLETVDDPPADRRPAKARPPSDHGLEFADDDPPPPPKPRSKAVRPLPPPESSAEVDLEVVEDDPPPPKPHSKAVRPLPPPESSAELDVEVIEEPPPPPARLRRPASEAITTDPPRSRPRLTSDRDDPADDDDDAADDRPRRPGRRTKRRRRDNESGGVAAVLIAIGVVALLWLVLTPIAFFARPVAITMVGLGLVSFVCSRFAFYSAARKELGSSYFFLQFIPFYDLFFFFTHIHRMLPAFVLWVVGFFFLITGAGALGFHDIKDDPSHAGNLTILAGGPPGVITGRMLDDEMAKLMSGPKQDARAWLRQPANRRQPGMRHLADLVEQAYQNGATAVWVVHPDPDDDDEWLVLATIPDNPAARQTLLAWYRTACNPLEPDNGQKFLIIADPD